MVAGGSRTLNWSSPELVLPFGCRELASSRHEPSNTSRILQGASSRHADSASQSVCSRSSLSSPLYHVFSVHCTVSRFTFPTQQSLYRVFTVPCVHCTMCSLLDEFGQFCSRPCVHAPHSAVHCTVCSQYCTVYSRSPLSSPLYRVFTVRRVRTVLSKLQSWKRARRWTPQPAILSKVSSNRVTDLFVGARIIHLERSDCAYGDRVVYPLRDVVRSCSVL